MILKIIHYCWFGGAPFPELIQNCIDSWKKYLPDYEFKKWDEQSFDINSVPYVAQAYKKKKWAFIADYIRIWALKNYGGIYLDSDVEVLKPFDDLLNQSAFVCIESQATEEYPLLEAAVIGSEKEGIWINKVFEYFDNKNFTDVDGKNDVTPLPYPLALKTKELYDVKFNNEEQKFDGLTVYPMNWFSCSPNLTKNMYAIHHYNGSWLPKYCFVVANHLKKYGKSFVSKVFCFVLHPIMTIETMRYQRTNKSNYEQICKSIKAEEDRKNGT